VLKAERRQPPGWRFSFMNYLIFWADLPAKNWDPSSSGAFWVSAFGAFLQPSLHIGRSPTALPTKSQVWRPVPSEQQVLKRACGHPQVAC